MFPNFATTARTKVASSRLWPAWVASGFGIVQERRSSDAVCHRETSGRLPARQPPRLVPVVFG